MTRGGKGVLMAAGPGLDRAPALLQEFERREARAFDRLAADCDQHRLTTTDWTFARYRQASLGRPLFEAYPDLVFRYIATRLGVGGDGMDREHPLRGLRVLDLGAGDGAWSVVLAEQGARVTSVEISPKQVELARERMKRHGLEWDARVGSAFHLQEEFPEGTFDLVFGPAVLHHLTQDLPRVYAGVRHLLRPGGYGVFLEPYVGAPRLRHLRERLAWLVPLDRESPDERPLVPEDLAPLAGGFAGVEVELSDLLAKLGRRVFRSRSIERRLFALDRWLLRSRRLRSLAGMVFIGLRR